MEKETLAFTIDPDLKKRLDLHLKQVGVKNRSRWLCQLLEYYLDFFVKFGGGKK